MVGSDESVRRSPAPCLRGDQSGHTRAELPGQGVGAGLQAPADWLSNKLVKELLAHLGASHRYAPPLVNDFPVDGSPST